MHKTSAWQVIVSYIFNRDTPASASQANPNLFLHGAPPRWDRYNLMIKVSFSFLTGIGGSLMLVKYGKLFYYHGVVVKPLYAKIDA